jgi:hypothetical protein
VLATVCRGKDGAIAPDDPSPIGVDKVNTPKIVFRAAGVS